MLQKHQEENRHRCLQISLWVLAQTVLGDPAPQRGFTISLPLACSISSDLLLIWKDFRRVDTNVQKVLLPVEVSGCGWGPLVTLKILGSSTAVR